jgi:hypothetical protein
VSRPRKLLLTLLLTGAAGTCAGAATHSAFSDTTASGESSFSAGSVSLSDNDAGAALVSLPAAAQPGDSSTGCIKVTYGGSLPASVRLYATVSGGLAAHLTLTVTRGDDGSPSFPSCSGFVPDAADYGYGPNGVVYQGALSGFPSSYASGIVDPTPGSAETWTPSESHSYRYAISLNDDPAAQGLSSSATFRWDARNQ